MKAIILNSGMGNRMGELTSSRHKAMVKLKNGETVYERQIRILKECGIKEFIITVGAFKEQLMQVTKRKEFEGLTFAFVENPVYDKTNYIYSMHLAKEYITGDCLLLHGDLVFNKSYAKKVIESPVLNLGSVNTKLKLPDKDFKAHIEDGKIKKVAIDIFHEGCYAFQPFYKLSSDAMKLWMNEIAKFCNDDNTKVYAENALNLKLDKICLEAFSYEHDYVEEIDTLEDLERVSEGIRFFDYKEQLIYEDDFSKNKIFEFLDKNKLTNPLIVCGKNTGKLELSLNLKTHMPNSIVFSDYSSNPKYEEVINGASVFKENSCDCLIAIGGGSAIDVSKSIKAYLSAPSSEDFLSGNIEFSPLKIIAIPTTAGTGSESTKFAVLYVNDEKMSIEHDSLLPDMACLVPELIENLPDYHKKSSMMDALAQCIESIWAKGAKEASKEYATKGLKYIVDNMESYITGDLSKNNIILKAANLSGKAINISKTTAAHAMSYKLSSMFGISHGHAVALCLPYVMKLMGEKVESEEDTVKKSLQENVNIICEVFGEKSMYGVADRIIDCTKRLGLYAPEVENIEQVHLLSKSVNTQRLKNNPIDISASEIEQLYGWVLNLKQTK